MLDYTSGSQSGPYEPYWGSCNILKKRKKVDLLIELNVPFNNFVPIYSIKVNYNLDNSILTWIKLEQTCQLELYRGTSVVPI